MLALSHTLIQISFIQLLFIYFQKEVDDFPEEDPSVSSAGLIRVQSSVNEHVLTTHASQSSAIHMQHLLRMAILLCDKQINYIGMKSIISKTSWSVKH